MNSKGKLWSLDTAITELTKSFKSILLNHHKRNSLRIINNNKSHMRIIINHNTMWSSEITPSPSFYLPATSKKGSTNNKKLRRFITTSIWSLNCFPWQDFQRSKGTTIPWWRKLLIRQNWVVRIGWMKSLRDITNLMPKLKEFITVWGLLKSKAMFSNLLISKWGKNR